MIIEGARCDKHARFSQRPCRPYTPVLPKAKLHDRHCKLVEGSIRVKSIGAEDLKSHTRSAATVADIQEQRLTMCSRILPGSKVAKRMLLPHNFRFRAQG